ncbi:MAG: integrin alpha [Planctomycetota bacterium]
MKSSILTSRYLIRTAGVLGLGMAAVFGLTVACNLGGQGGGGTPPNDNGGVGGCALLNIVGNIQIPTGSEFPLLVLYNIDASATDVGGFYVQVASASPDAPEIGEDVIAATGLSPGAYQAFSLPIAQFTAGFYRVGLRFTLGGEAGRCTSSGTLEATGTALPEFTQPASNVLAEEGDDIPIGFDMHDPAGALQWRLFYISTNGPFDEPPDDLGTQIRIGQGDSDIVLWSTSGVPLGVYFVGLSTTASGLTIEETVVAGEWENAVRTILNPFTITLEEPQPPVTENSPLIEVTEPAGTEMAELGEDNVVSIEFEGTIRDLNAVNPTIDVFLDLDNSPGSGNELGVDSNLPPTTTSTTVNTQALELGTYFVYALIDDGVNPAVTDYAPGQIVVALNIPKLDVQEPDLNLPVKPGTEVSVRWTTSNILADAAEVDVFRRAVGADGQPTGAEIVILAPTNAGVHEATFVAAESGRFQVSARIVFNDPTVADLVDVAPRLVQVTTLPLVLWVGDLAEFDADVEPTPRGAIFEGHQFEDNAGSSFAGGEDFNDDNIDDFLIGAQYGKPEFINPTGIGDGEVYLIRGKSARYRGSYNLNEVSSPTIPGAVITGIPPVVTASPPETWGIASMFIASDADGDGVGELLVGLPYVLEDRDEPPDAFGEMFTRPTMFENGGVVVVSSQNNVVNGSYDTTGGRLLLEWVGQDFTERLVCPEPADGCSSSSECNPDWCWLADRFTYYEGDCPGDTAEICDALDPLASPPQFDGCLDNLDFRIDEPDGILDTLEQPTWGFNEYLAVGFLEHYTAIFGEFPCEGEITPCPGCNPNHPSTPGCVCEQWVFNTFTELWELNSGTQCPQTTYDQGTPSYPDTLTCDAEGVPCADQHDFIRNQLNLNFLRRPWLDVDLGSGFYRTSDPEQPWGCRMIGRPMDLGHDELSAFGMSMTQSGTELLISAPDRDAVNGEDVTGLLSTGVNAGIAYLFTFFDLWEGNLAPRPHVYKAGGGGATGADRDVFFSRGGSVPGVSGGLHVAGRPDERIQNLLGIPDFNKDTRPDFVVGGPRANGDNGAAYVVFRRANSLEGDYVLDKLVLPLSDAVRLAGAYIRGNMGEAAQFGASLAGGSAATSGVFDFNGDGVEDIAIGAPNGNSGTGEVLIVFGTNNTLSDPVALDGSILVDALLAQGRAALIMGDQVDGSFGLNMANAGDLDGDGTDDLLIAAPYATPRYDPSPNDAVDQLSSDGLDRNLDGLKDDVTGPNGVPDGTIDDWDSLEGAGLVYVIYGSADPSGWASTVPATLGWQFISISELGTADLPGFIIAGRRGTDPTQTNPSTEYHHGDRLGGGDVADPWEGNDSKASTRPQGLGRAGDVDGDGNADILIGSILADPRVDPQTGKGTVNGGEAYLIYGFSQNP